MIYCVTQPLVNYNVTMNGQTVGLYESYGQYPPLFNLILLTTLIPFGYERGTEVEPPQRVVRIKEEEKFVRSLDMELKDERLSRVVQKLSPIEFYNDIKDWDISYLPLCDYYSTGQEAVKMLVAARAVAWAMHYRGPVSQEGNVIQAAFGGLPIRIPSDMKIDHKGIVDAIKKRNRNTDK